MNFYFKKISKHSEIAFRSSLELKDVTPALDSTGQTNQSDVENKKPVKKAKWHLGIRSQSKPQDIMNEVFKAMKASNMVSYYFIF